MASPSTQTKSASSMASSYSYSYYRSTPRRQSNTVQANKSVITGLRKLIVLLLIIAVPAGYFFFQQNSSKTTNSPKSSSAASFAPLKTKPAATKPVAAPPAPVNYCQNNTLNQLLLVSVSRRHLWACAGPQQVFDTPVVTGDTQYADTTTPPGSYQIYGKATDLTLTGSSSLGTWHDPVSYWMPFLDNQYGAYGLHDATWRPASAFGNIDPSTTQASNGCVELPLASAKWIYDWVQIGATVTIQS
ncbi:MAG TPA: L,D-transpeptidase [Candidatus Saccharimonadales bacterium]|nr:L,D-transpeptidase [Candidatus Saccharimonadales bacterium]